MHITRFEYLLRKKKETTGEALSPEDISSIRAMRAYYKEELPLRVKAEALRLIRVKEIEIETMSRCLGIDRLQNGRYLGLVRYNNICRNVKKNITTNQWEILKSYYGGWATSSDMIEKDVK